MVWVTPKYSLQKAESLLLPEKALFHRRLSISARFVRRQFAAFLRKAMSYFVMHLLCTLAVLALLNVCIQIGQLLV